MPDARRCGEQGDWQCEYVLTKRASSLASATTLKKPPQKGTFTTMGLMDFIKGELIEIIEWTDDSRDTLCFRWPDDDKNIKNGAQLIVRESQVAQFVYLGQFGDAFLPGKHVLTTENIP